MSLSQGDIDQLQRAALVSLHEHWKFYLIEGIILVALGARRPSRCRRLQL